jgi:hypothetical protein
MTNTRHAAPGEPFPQERYCGRTEFERGLMANLVAKRCAVLDNAQDRELVWWLQLLSHQDGGLQKVADELSNTFTERIGTASMQRLGTAPGQVYSAAQVQEVREDMPTGYQADFRLKGDVDELEGLLSNGEDGPRWKSLDQSESNEQPVSYPAAAFVAACQRAVSELPAILERFCLDPAFHPAMLSPWFFPRLLESLRQFQASWIANKQSEGVVPDLGRRVYETLDYALSGRCLVLIDGLSRMGKTFAAKAWCDLHPGQARYVQVPASSDDESFYRKIAQSLGVGCSLSIKALQMRERIEYVLQTTKLMLVFDESTYLWPQNNRREALPNRINWILTALVNDGVPVALIVTPQFTKAQKIIERKTGWASAQLIGRIFHYEKLADRLEKEDVQAVSKAFVPEADANSIDLLAAYAYGSAKYLAGIESVARRARYLAGKAGREKVTFGDIKRAIQGSVNPSDSALAQALAEPSRPTRRPPIRSLETPFSPPLKPAETQQTAADFVPPEPTFAERIPAHKEKLIRNREAPTFS